MILTFYPKLHQAPAPYDSATVKRSWVDAFVQDLSEK